MLKKIRGIEIISTLVIAVMLISLTSIAQSGKKIFWENVYFGAGIYTDSIGSFTNGGYINFLNPVMVDNFYFNTTPSSPGGHLNGRLVWDTDYQTLKMQTANDVTIQLGQQTLMYCYNDTGSDILIGSAVYIGGVNGIYPKVALAQANSSTTYNVCGIAMQTLSNGQMGYVCVEGMVNNINTNSYTAGDILYLSGTSAGGMQNTIPTAPNLKVKIGKVVVKNATTGSMYVNLRQLSRLEDLSNVNIVSPSIDSVLKWNGNEWVNGSSSSSSSAGVKFYPDTTDIKAKNTQNAFAIKTLNDYPVTTAETTSTISCVSNTAIGNAYLYNTALNMATVGAGSWTFNMYASTSSIDDGRISNITLNMYKVTPYTSPTISTSGGSTIRTCTASGGTPFAVANVDASSTNTVASYVQTGKGLYQILTIVSDTEVTIEVPAVYTNESDVAFNVWKKMFGDTSPSITNTGTNYCSYSINTAQPTFTFAVTDKLGMVLFGTSNNTTTLNYVYNGSSHYSYVSSSIIEGDGLGNGTAENQLPVTGTTPFTGVWTTATGTGSPVLATSPTLTTPNIGSATGSVSGNAGTVTNATLTTALTVNTGTVTLTGDVANTSVLTIGAGAVGVSGTNTGDNATNSQYSGLVTNATHTGDATGSGALTVVALNGTNLAALSTGVLKNTTTTGIPFISKVAITEPATASTLTIVDGATLTVSATASVSGTNTGDNAVNSTALALDQTTPQTAGDTTNRIAKLWATDITVTNAITGSVTGNAGTVTNGIYTNSENVIGAGQMKGTGSAKLANGSAGNLMKSLGDGTFGWDTTTYLSGVTAHNLLSTTHGDTTAASVVRGDIMVGKNASPKWESLAIGTSGKVVVSDGTDVAWSTNALGTMAWLTATDYIAKSMLTEQGDIIYASAVSTPAALAHGTAGQLLRTGGDGANPAWTTPTYPNTATAGKVLIGDGTNVVLSTPTFPNASATTGKAIVSDGTNWVASTPTFPNTSATARKIIVSDGTDWTASTELWPVATTTGNVLVADGTNWTTSAPSLAKIGNGTAENQLPVTGTTPFIPIWTTATGSGAPVLANTPTFVTPILGTPTSGTLTNCTFPTLNQDTTGNANTATTATNVTAADEATDTTCYPVFVTSTTGSLGAKTNAGFTFNSNKQALGVGVATPTAKIHIKEGTATADTAPLKLTQASAVVLSSPEAGAIECNDGDELYYTVKTGPTRKTIAYTDSNITGTAAMKLSSPDTSVWTLTIDNDGILTATKP